MTQLRKILKGILKALAIVAISIIGVVLFVVSLLNFLVGGRFHDSSYSPEYSSSGQYYSTVTVNRAKPKNPDYANPRITVFKASDKSVVDSVVSRESDAMKWVSMWSQYDDTYLLYGTDFGSYYAWRIQDGKLVEVPITDKQKRELDAKFAQEYN